MTGVLIAASIVLVSCGLVVLEILFAPRRDDWE